MFPSRSPLAYDVVRSVEDIDEADWNDMCGGRPFAGYRWLRLAEQVRRGHEARYLLLRRRGRLEAAAVCSLGRTFQRPDVQRWAGWVLRRFPSLRCAVPITLDSGLIVRPGCDAAELVPLLLSGLEHLAAREHASFTRLDYLTPTDAGWTSLARSGYAPVSMWTDTALNIDWGTFDEYLANLPRRKRQELRRISRRGESEGIAVEPTSVDADSAAVLHALVENVLRRHAADDRYASDLFVRASALLGDDLTVLVARRSGRIVGCASLLRSGGEVAAKWLGLDYELAANTVTYHRLILACVDQAIAMGARRLRLGSTAYETKRHFGVELEERVGAFALRGRILTGLAGLVLGAGFRKEPGPTRTGASDDQGRLDGPHRRR